MLRKFTIGAIIALTAAGCASVSPAGDKARTAAQPLQIRGDLVDLTDVRIFINEDKVIDAQVSLLRGDGEFSGTWAGRPVRASCSTAPQRKVAGTTCLVSVDDARAIALTF